MGIKMKRSLVAGKVPAVSDIELGELAVNTHDGKLFLKKNDGTDAIVEIGAQSVTSVAGRTGAVTLAKADIGLGNVDNTEDAAKPVSNATQASLDGKANTAHSHAIDAVSGLQTALDGKAAVSHAHEISSINGLSEALAGAGDDSIWFYGHVHGEIDAAYIFGAETDDWFITIHAPYAFNIEQFIVYSQAASGVAVTVYINGVAVSGLNPLSLINANTKYIGAANANRTVAVGDRVSFRLTGQSTSDEHFSWALKGTLI